MKKPVLFSCKGYGSVIAECVMTLAGVDFENRRISEEQVGRDSEILRPHNPLGQVPTMILPNGKVLTESAAITLFYGEGNGEIVPPPGSAERSDFLRYLIMFVSPIYATFSYGDVPKKWVKGQEAEKDLRLSTDEWRNKLWLYIENQIEPKPWFLGERFSALDIYITAMVFWRPRQEWFEKNCPKLFSIHKHGLEYPKLKDVFKENFASYSDV